MAKSRIGPFALEAPLSPPKSSGQLFRGVHLEQRKLAALRIFPTPMGMTPESRQAFASQLEELKSLRHPNIVRCYGGGFDARSAYLAYELVDGESLRETLSRRERMPWETVLELAKQATEGLQYAHQMGWVHGRISPSKLLLCNDGTIKIADWRRDSIASMLDAPVKRYEMQFMAPEILSGQAVDPKADLYALGATMYALLTGKPPFDGSDAKSLLNKIETRDYVPVTGVVLDCPVWLNAILEQLLSLEPRNRPYSAVALQLAFNEAQRRQNEGVGVLQHATAGFSPLQLNVDRGEAEKLLGIKPKKEREPTATPFWERTWFMLAAFVAALSIVIWFMLPLSEQSLRLRAERLLASDQWLDWNEARDMYLYPIRERFPDSENAKWAQSKIAWVNAREAERRIDFDEPRGRTEDWSPAQTQYAAARKYERFGDGKTALQRYQNILQLYGANEDDAAIIALVNEAVARINESPVETNLATFLRQRISEAERLMQQAKVSEATQRLETLVELYEDNSEATAMVDRAKELLRKLSK